MGSASMEAVVAAEKIEAMIESDEWSTEMIAEIIDGETRQEGLLLISPLARLIANDLTAAQSTLNQLAGYIVKHANDTRLATSVRRLAAQLGAHSVMLTTELKRQNPPPQRED